MCRSPPAAIFDGGGGVNGGGGGRGGCPGQLRPLTGPQRPSFPRKLYHRTIFGTGYSSTLETSQNAAG